MEANSNSLDLWSDTINIVVEFAQPESNVVEENGEISKGSNNQAEHVIHLSPALFNSAVPLQASSISNINCSESTAGEIQETSRIDVVERIKKCVRRRKTSNPSNSLALPVSNPALSYRPRPSITSLQQPSISLQIQNGQVTQKPQSFQKEAELVSVSSPTLPNQMGGTQITSATKLVLRNFLKKKSERIVNDNSSKRGTSDCEAQIISAVGESGSASKEDGTCTDHGSKVKNNLSATGNECENNPDTVVVSESSSLDPVQSNQDTNATSSDELTSTVTVVQGADSNSPLDQQSDIVHLDTECNQTMEQGGKVTSTPTKELSTDVVNASIIAAVSEEAMAPIVQEVDVVVLPSLLEPDVSEQSTERSQGKPQGKSGTKKHKAKKSRDCVECGKIFTSQNTYKAHMNIHYDIRPHKCSDCGKSFRQRGHLHKHKLLHIEEKPYVCQYCGWGFRCRYQHRDHERIHTGEKPCKCNLCGKMFRCLNSVASHQRSVHKVCPRPRRCDARKGQVYTCKICGKTFKWQSALSAHKKSHNDVWQYKCKKCPKVFKCYSNLWNHKNSHSKEKPFKCDLCGQRLKRRGNLKRHILTQHDPEEAEECLKTSKEFEAYRARKQSSS